MAGVKILVSRILSAAADLVDKGWCQWSQARNASGESCPIAAPAAVQWCAQGAIRRAAYDRIQDPMTSSAVVYHANCAVAETLGVVHHHQVGLWNDSSECTSLEVAATLRAAGERCIVSYEQKEPPA